MLKVQHKLGKYGNKISEFVWISDAHSFIYSINTKLRSTTLIKQIEHNTNRTVSSYVRVILYLHR